MATPQSYTIRRDRSFYLWVSVFMAVVTFAGFARTYYLRGVFHAEALTLFLHIHGAVMTAWIVLFLLQSLLIATHRVKFHRRLGFFGVSLATLVVILGMTATIHAAAREVRGHTEFVPLQLSVLALETTQLLLFACFVGTAIWLRRKADIHKRFLLLATLCMLPNPEVRMLPFIHNNLVFLLLWSAAVFSFVAIELFARAMSMQRSCVEPRLPTSCFIWPILVRPLNRGDISRLD